MEVARSAGRLLAAAAMACAALPVIIPAAQSQSCPDIGVVFARGTAEPPGVGSVGQRFVDSLRAQVFPRTVGVHGVVYPASGNFTAGPVFTQNVVDGVRDETFHVQGVTSVCPNTRMVLGGYSQGAVVTALTTSGQIPAGTPPGTAPPPMSDDVVDNVAAVVLFGKPAGWSVAKYGVPALGVGAAYATKVLELCAPGDTVCTAAPVAGPANGHQAYAVNGMTDQAAAFTVGQLARTPLPV
ncbi:cutinase family protein [[Mycobacterium] wendilense]|uniref:Cutinase family protein n=1 Tax=[Mycobacterium] wendilense TaxID=3064284 RepID=A0ABM9MDY7_9MYCO|nr:cutinase family protein [Mycolicibacterium sp. MU0050]CAJ1582895.1 cutinase family protein [Mycolicibacterium sp. MU0050]